MHHKHAALRVLLIIAAALAIVAGISYLPLERWTGGRVKNFNLIADILPDSLLPGRSPADTVERIDPALLKAEADARNVAARLDSLGNAVYTDTIIGREKPSTVNDTVVIEDYTDGEVGLYRLRRALDEPRAARITVVGDSYIEGDIFTQNLRENLQDAYGGSGVGYMNMHSDFPGFRRSIRQGGNGWKEYKGGKKGSKARYVGLSEQYFMPSANALATYKGTQALGHLEEWNLSQFLFVAPNNTTVMVKTTGDWVEHRVQGSDSVQCITIEGATPELDLRVNDRSFAALGVWLNDSTGIAVDCMSSRGYSGVTLAKIDVDLCRQMAQWVDYDLIILEFGINAMTAGQTDYSVYCDRLVRVINHVRNCYPHADVLLMGIGDRGAKHGGMVTSMSTAPHMVAAQREAARRAHCLFWDTRQAMGGDGAIVRWAAEGKANKDYIHLTHKGGAELANLLSAAIQRMLDAE